MNWFVDLKTGAKLLLGFGLIVLLMALVVFSAKRGIDAVEQGLGLALSLSGFESNVNENRATVLTMLAGADRETQQQMLEDLRAQAIEARALLQRAREQAVDRPDLIQRLDALSVPWDEFSRVRDQTTLPLVRSGDVEGARAVSLVAQNQRYLALREQIRAIADEARAQARSAAEQSLQVFFLFGATALLASILVAWLLAHLIAGPLREISRAAERIAVGDLSVQVAGTERRDEVGALAQSFARMSTALRRLTAELSEGINVLSASATQISTSTSQFAASAAETASAVSETTTTLEEVRQTAQVSSHKARAVSESAQRVSQVSESGRRYTEETTAGMQRIQQQMEAIAESMVRLSEQSLAVGQIVATVEDLAAQSKVLAVNASIEAVKAGEFGKGFAVVAQEVRSLAEQSRQATAQVRSILGAIQKATSAAVLATEQGSDAVAAGVQQSQQAGQSIQALAGSIAEAAQAATLIAASSQQQLVGVDQVASAMESIKLASTQNVDSAKQLEGAALSIKSLGEKLRQLADSYQV